MQKDPMRITNYIENGDGLYLAAVSVPDMVSFDKKTCNVKVRVYQGKGYYLPEFISGYTVTGFYRIDQKLFLDYRNTVLQPESYHQILFGKCYKKDTHKADKWIVECNRIITNVRQVKELKGKLGKEFKEDIRWYRLKW